MHPNGRFVWDNRTTLADTPSIVGYYIAGVTTINTDLDDAGCS